MATSQPDRERKNFHPSLPFEYSVMSIMIIIIYVLIFFSTIVLGAGLSHD